MYQMSTIDPGLGKFRAYLYVYNLATYPDGRKEAAEGWKHYKERKRVTRRRKKNITIIKTMHTHQLW